MFFSELAANIEMYEDMDTEHEIMLLSHRMESMIEELDSIESPCYGFCEEYESGDHLSFYASEDEYVESIDFILSDIKKTKKRISELRERRKCADMWWDNVLASGITPDGQVVLMGALSAVRS